MNTLDAIVEMVGQNPGMSKVALLEHLHARGIPIARRTLTHHLKQLLEEGRIRKGRTMRDARLALLFPPVKT